MKKKLLGLITLLLAASLTACGSSQPSQGGKSTPASEQGTSQGVVTRYTVKFENNGERVATESVKEGETLTAAQIPTVRAPEGKVFKGWANEQNEIVDLTTYVVTGDVTFHAVFEDEQEQGDVLSVDDVKEAGKTYYLVLGWWEVNDPAEPDKITSHLTKTTVRLFYNNLINYLKASGATDENIANIQFRNYSTATVAEMGQKINADGDVDLMIGVGNNINSSSGAAVSLYNSSNDYKFQTPMGDGTARYVACLSTATELGVSTYTWLKNTDVGIASFIRVLTAAEIEASLVPVDLDFTVVVHGDTEKTTVLHSKDDVVEMPAITIPEGKIFKGFALTADGEVALDVAKDATLKYDNVKGLVAEGVKKVDLYPVIENAPVVEDDLVVYVQVNGSNLTMAEAKLLEARFNSTLTTEKVKFNIIDGNASAFSGAIGDDSDVIIGGNNPVNNLGKHAEGPTANAGAKHFANTSRKVIISDKCTSAHLELAKKLYNFVIADAIEFEVHAAFWRKGGDWITADEYTALQAGIKGNLETYMGVEADKLLDTYNIKLTYVDVEGTKVADLGAATNALREGKGTDLVIGCGGNVTSTGLVPTVGIFDIPTTMVAAGRKVGLVKDNCLTRNIVDVYFGAGSAIE